MSGNLWRYRPNDVGDPVLYCELCDFSAATTLGLDAHNYSYKHLNKVELTRNDPHRRARDNQNKDYHCELCQVFCSDKEMLKTHLRGQKHLKKLANSDNSVGFYQTSTTKNSKIKLKASVLEGKLIDFDRAIVGLDYIVEIHPTDNKKEPRFLCELCDAKSDIRVVVSHLVGQKHRQNYLKLNRYDYETIIKGRNNSKMKAEELEEFMVTIEAEDGRGRVIIKEEFDDKVHKVEPQEEDAGCASDSDDERKPDTSYDYRYEDDRKEDVYKYDWDHRSRHRSSHRRHKRNRHSRSPHSRSSRSRSPHSRSSRSRSPHSRSSRSRSPGEADETLDVFKYKMERVTRRREGAATWKQVFGELYKMIDDYKVQCEEEASMALSVSNTLTQKLMSYRLTRIPASVRNLIDLNLEQ